MNPSTSTERSCFSEADSHTEMQSNLQVTLFWARQVCSDVCVFTGTRAHTHVCRRWRASLWKDDWDLGTVCSREGTEGEELGWETNPGGLCVSLTRYIYDPLMLRARGCSPELPGRPQPRPSPQPLPSPSTQGGEHQQALKTAGHFPAEWSWGKQ